MELLFEIAGKGSIANADAMILAMKFAVQLSKHNK